MRLDICLGLGTTITLIPGIAVPGHEGHLMAGNRSIRAAQDDFNRIAGYIVSRGQSKGSIIWLPGSKTCYENARERDAK